MTGRQHDGRSSMTHIQLIYAWCAIAIVASLIVVFSIDDFFLSTSAFALGTCAVWQATKECKLEYGKYPWDFFTDG